MKTTTYKGFTIENVSDFMVNSFKVELSKVGFMTSDVYTSPYWFNSELKAKRFITKTLKHGQQENIEYFQRKV